MTFEEQVSALKNELAQAKAVTTPNIQSIKQQFLAQTNIANTTNNLLELEPGVSDLLEVTPGSETVNDLYELGDAARRVEPTSPVVEQEGNLFKHADGLYSVRTAEGRTVSGLDELTARQLAVYNQENFRAVKEGAPTDFVGRKLHGIGQTTIDLGVQGASMFTGSTTLPQTVNSYNRFSGRVPITDADISQYQAIKSADKELTPAQQIFQNSTKFQKLISLDKEAQKNRSQFEAIQQFGKNLKSKIPVNRKDQFAAKVAFDTIAKNEGNWAAAWHTVTNDLDTLLSQGIDSIPYMVAFTIGGPIAQTGILTTLAIGRGNQAVEEFRTKYNKEPTTDEVTRIKIWAAVGTVAEKYGDMAAVRAIPGRLSWIRRTQQATKQTIPSKILDLGVFRPTLALAGEGLSGAITAASEKMGEAGELTDEDTGDIVYDALAEAFGTPGGIAGMIGGKALYTAAKLPFKPSDIEQRLINLDAAIASKDEVLYGATSKSRDERSELEELTKALQDIKKSKNREVLIKDVTEELVKKAKEKAPETELTPLEEEQIAAQAETEVDRRIREAEAREEELITKLETPISEEETKTYKEELRQDRIKIQAEDKKRKEAKAEAKAKKKALKTPEGKQSRIAEIEAEIAAIKSEPGFPDEQQIKELVAEKDELSDETIKEDTTHTPIEEDEFNAFIESLPSADVIANPDTDPDVLDKALDLVAEVYKRKSLTQEQIDKVDPIVKQIGGLDPDYKEEPMGSLKGLLNADARQLKTALRIAKEKDKKEGKDVTVNQDVVNAAIAAKSKLKELKAIKEPSDKNMQEVHEEVEGGMSTRWTGLNTYYNKIVEIITENRDIPKGDTLAEPQIINLENEMKTHVTNLKEKRDAFTIAYNRKPAPKGMVNVVYGKRDEEAEGRAMIYSQDTIPIEQYEEERGGKKKVYVNAIMTEEAVAIQENENYKFTSDVLIQKVGAEAAYGNELLTVVTGYKNTSFSRDAAQQASRRRALAIKKKQAVSVKFKKKKVPIEIIRNIKELQAEQRSRRPDAKPRDKKGPYADWTNEQIAAALKKEEEKKVKAEGKTSTTPSTTTTTATTTEKLLEIAKKTFNTFTKELKDKKTRVMSTDKIKALAQASSTNLTIALNIVAIVKDFQNDMAYLDGKGKGIHANSSIQKEEVFKNVDVPAFKKFIRDNGGIAAYLKFIYQHEKSHIINKDSEKYPQKKDGTADLMHPDAIAIERSANAYAFRKIGFKAYTEEKKPTPTIEYKDLNYTVAFPDNATWDEAWETATITNKENKERYAKSAPNAGADRRAIIAKAFLQKGLAIEVTDRGTTYTYIISSKTIISPKSNNVVFEQPPTGHNGNRDRILHAAETKLKTTKVGKVGKPPTPESLQVRMTAKIATVIKESAKKWLGKEQVKTKIATQFIGEGGSNTSTARYAKMYADEGLANTGKYTSEDVIFIASNGNRDKGIAPVNSKGELQGKYTNITAAIEAGATIVMDTRQHIVNTTKPGRRFQNTGELALARYLAANGYAREGGSGIWKPKPKAAAPTVEISEVKKGSFEIDILTEKGEHKKQKIEGQVIEANGVPIIGIGKRKGENWTLTHIATGGHFPGTFKKKYQAVAAAQELAELANSVDYTKTDATTLTKEERKIFKDTTKAIATKIKEDPFYGKPDTALAKREKELEKKLKELNEDSGITGSIGSPKKKAEERAKILKELEDVQNEIAKRKEAAEAKHIRPESEGPVSDETTEGSDETTGDAGKVPGDTSTSKQKKGKVGKIGRKKGTKSPQQIAEEQEKEKQIAEDEKSRSIPTEALSKQALHVLFPEIISPEGTLIDEADTKNAGLLAKLATQLGISGASIEEISAVLEKLPDRKNFAEGALETFSPAVTEEQLDKSKTEAHKKHGGKTVAQRKAVNLENIFGILGRFITKLLNFKRNKELIDGIHTLPAAVFRGITDDTGRKQYKSLERALEALGASKETAVLMAKEYSRFQRKYQAVRADATVAGMGEGGNIAITKPLSVLSSNGELPPQVVFTMMLGINNWVHQNPSNVVFRSPYDKQRFLYGNHAKNLSDNESKQLRDVGHSYVTAHSLIGNDIASILNISAMDEKSAAYFDNLVPALGMMALRIEHGPSTWDKQRKEGQKGQPEQTLDKDPSLTFEEDAAKFRLEVKEWDFKEAVAEDRLFNNATTKAEINELIEEGRAEYNEDGKLISTDTGELVEVKITDYRHIRINLRRDSKGKEIPAKFSDAEVDAKKEMLEVLGADIETEAHKPRQTPKGTVVEFIKNSLGGVPVKVASVLRQLQNVSWTAAETMDIAAKLDQAGFRETMYKLAGTQAVDENDHEAIQESVNSSNDDKINALDDLLLAYDNNGEKNSLKKFYFEYQLQNQHRILMQGQINPQQSHVSRYFVRSWKSIRYKEKNLWKFKLAVAGNLGFKVDKNDLGAALEAFDNMINDPDILSAVNAIQRIDEGGQATELAELIGKIQSRDEYKSVDMSLLNGLTGLSKALNPDGTLKESFNSDVALEIDGISNGFAQNVLQFPMFGEEITEKRLNQTATYIGVTTADTTHITPPDQPDSYQDLGEMVRKHSGIVVDKDGEPTGEPTEESIDTAYEYSRTYKKKFTRQQYISRVKALFNLYPALTNGDFRDLVKYPFMIFMYGGGISRISKDVAKDILKEMYVKLNMHQKKYNSLKTAKGKADYMKKDIMPFLNDLTAVGAISKPHEFAKKMSDPEIGSQKEYFNETAFLSRVGDTIAPRLDAGLMEMLGETKEARDAAVQAAELLHAVFITHYDKAYKEAITLRDKNGEKIGERPPLTEREIDKLVKEQLIELLPQYKGPLMQTDQSFIDLTKRQKRDDVSNAERIQNVFTNQDGGISHDTGSPRVTTFIAPGVSALIRMIINMDSAILTKTLERHPKLLMLHDAVMGDPETLAEAEKTYGKFYVEFNQEYSVLGTITKQVHKVLNKTRDMDAKNNTNLMGAIDTWIRGKAFVNKNAKGEDVKNTDDLVKHVDSVNDTVKEARAALKQRISERGGIVSHQLYMAKKSMFEGVEEFVRGRSSTRTLINRLIDSMLESVPKEEREKPPTYKDQERIGKEYREKVKEKDENIKRLNKARARKEYRKRGKEPPSWATSGLTKEQIEEDDKFEEDFSNGELGSLDFDQRDNPDPIKELTGDITEDNIMELFSDFTGFSAKYYNSDAEMAEHTGVLNKILTILAKGMDSTKSIYLTAEDVDGITQGGYDKFSDKIRVSMARKPPLAANAQSPQEVYVHEMVHAMVKHVLSKNPLLKRRIEKLYRQVRRELQAGEGYEVFLRSIPGGVKNASKQDKEFAHAKYDYIFNNIENEANRLDEFLAYAVTDRDFVNYLSSTKSKIHLKFKEDGSVFGKAIEVFQYFMEVIVDTLVRILGKRGGFGANANAEMIAVIGELITIQGKHKTKLQLLRDKTYSYLDASDQAIRTFAEEQSVKLINSEKGNILQRAYRTATGIGYTAFSKNAEALHIRQAVIERMNYTLRSIAHEISEGSLSRDLITQLLTSKVRISKARQESERYTIDWFDTIWKSVDLKKDSKSMTVYTREALTNVLFRTDLSSLLNVGLSHREIADLLGDKTKINDTLKEYKRKILKKKAKKFQKIRHALDYASELGEFMATGDTTLEENHMNAYTIAHTILANHTADDVAALDAIATLTALTHLDTREVKNVKELVENEFTASSTGNGFIDLLDSHSEYNQRSKRDLFEDNSAQMMKGYIIERVDDLTGIKTGLLEQTAEMKKEGYTEDPILLGPIPGLKPGDKTHNALFAGRYVPAIPYVSAVMSTTNKRNMGTTITEILSENPKYQKSPGVPNMAMINQAIYDISKEQRVQAKTLIKNRELRLRPVRNDKVQTTDYRIIMNHKTRKKILKPDLEIQNVFAHMQSSFIDRKNTIKSDKRTVELLVHEQKELMPESKPRTFVDLLDPENGYIDRYYRLPKEVRMYIDKLAKNGTFMVREDIIDKVFGYQAKDFRNLNFLQSPRMARMKRWAGLTHYILREIVGYGKDRIVIAMPTVVFNNAMSNVYQLTMRKVPITYTIHKLMEGFHEYKQYSDDHEELRKLKNRRDYKKLPDTAEEHSLILALETRIKANRIHRMSEAGLQNLIVEDLNNASMDGLVNKARRYLRMGPLAKHMTGKVPTAAVQVAAHAVFAKTTEPYQLARTIVQLTDFLGRYVMIEHAMEVRGLSFEDAMHEALDAFVLFDEALAPALEAVDAVGATSFLSYFLRNQRASRQMVMQNPTGVALSGAFQYTTGIQTLGNVNASFLNGDIQPNLMQLDDLFDEADNLTGVDLLRDFWHAMFG